MRFQSLCRGNTGDYDTGSPEGKGLYMKFGFYPRGVCSQYMEFDIEDNVIRGIDVKGGCNGNLTGITKLVKGMTVDETISCLRGIDCGGRGTSCPDQLARALEEYKRSQKASGY